MKASFGFRSVLGFCIVLMLFIDTINCRPIPMGPHKEKTESISRRLPSNARRAERSTDFDTYMDFYQKVYMPYYQNYHHNYLSYPYPGGAAVPLPAIRYPYPYPNPWMLQYPYPPPSEGSMSGEGTMGNKKCNEKKMSTEDGEAMNSDEIEVKTSEDIPLPLQPAVILPPPSMIMRKGTITPKTKYSSPYHSSSPSSS